MFQHNRLGSGLTFSETMSGPFTMGALDPSDGAKGSSRLVLHGHVTIADMAVFRDEPRPPATFAGELEVPGVRERIPFGNGVFRLFPASGPAPRTLMVYELGFDLDGERHHLVGYKNAGEAPSVTRLWRDTTTLHTRLHRGCHGRAEVVGAGVLRLSAAGLARLVASMRTPRSTSSADTVRALGGYATLFARSLTRTYVLKR